MLFKRKRKIKSYHVVVRNMGEPMDAWFTGYTIRQIKRNYKLEKLEIISIEEVKSPNE